MRSTRYFPASTSPSRTSSWRWTTDSRGGSSKNNSSSITTSAASATVSTMTYLRARAKRLGRTIAPHAALTGDKIGNNFVRVREEFDTNKAISSPLNEVPVWDEADSRNVSAAKRLLYFGFTNSFLASERGGRDKPRTPNRCPSLSAISPSSACSGSLSFRSLTARCSRRSIGRRSRRRERAAPVEKPGTTVRPAALERARKPEQAESPVRAEPAVKVERAPIRMKPAASAETRAEAAAPRAKVGLAATVGQAEVATAWAALASTPLARRQRPSFSCNTARRAQ